MAAQPDNSLWRGIRATNILPWLFVAVAAYVLSFGPIDWLVERDYLPPAALHYQWPLNRLADNFPVLHRFLHWYVADVWGVYEPLLR